MKKLYIFLLYGLLCATNLTAHAQSGTTNNPSSAVLPPRSAEFVIPPLNTGITIGDGIPYPTAPITTIIHKDGLDDKLLASNAEQIRQASSLQPSRIRRLSAREPLDLGDGMFLLGDDVDPTSSLLEVRLNTEPLTNINFQEITKLKFPSFSII